ncbi:MAG: 4-hydroxy-tetrahydrodipicolinate reductase [Bacteroidales bacterium]|jgi:4-hydroxy-tetrahydrodipicolinate reductase|nr:4-hydroxy-tetrahydrodipicolinate reductase [Bacteroidales bacterium]
MKIVISGYGKMGREIEKAALARGHEITARLDTPEDWQVDLNQLNSADVVIEFSTPASVLENIKKCFSLNLPVVVGTTGWHEHENMVKEWCIMENQSVFAASNFSIGMNILFSLTRQLSVMINRFDDYEVQLEEVHHIHKLDAPSGTAIKLAEIILAGLDRKQNWVNRLQASPGELQILSVRENEIPGIHKITCESDSEILSLVHEAKGRKGLAAGALLAAEWLAGKKGYFGMKDMLSFAE